jgi:hypothetical protein
VGVGGLGCEGGQLLVSHPAVPPHSAAGCCSTASRLQLRRRHRLSSTRLPVKGAKGAYPSRKARPARSERATALSGIRGSPPPWRT